MPAPEPFRIAISDSVLEQIARRVRTYRWADLPDAGGWSGGTALPFLRELCGYWSSDYDWRAAELQLNGLPHFRAAVAGLGLHFVHIRGSGPAPMPLLLSHGWPGSFAEFAQVVGPLAHPERYGGDPADAFDVVVPSLPGYVFSDRPLRPIGPRSAANYFDALMTQVLGYERYVAQGGDWGSAISAWLGYDHGTNKNGACTAVHLNMIVTLGTDMVVRTDEERAWKSERATLHRREGAYSELQSTKPQSLGYAMMDSPVGVAAWMIEKFAAWSDVPRNASGEPDLLAHFTRDQLLTAVMLYLVTRSFATSLWMYKGLFAEKPVKFPAGSRVDVPVGFAAFPDPVFVPPPRTLVERGYNITRWSEMPRGGHFAAMEAPELFTADVRAFAREFRRA